MWLNLNVYRNAHHRELDAAKKEFTKRVLPLVEDLPKLERVLIAYILYTPTKRSCDVANICTIVDKFFCDTLVKAGKIADDNRKILPIIAFRDGGVDNTNPRVDALIHSIGPNTDLTLTEGPVS